MTFAPDTLTAGLNESVGLNVTALWFTFGLSSLTAVVFGLVPAWQAARTEPHAALQSRARGGTADRRHHRIRSLLVVAEVALAVVLLVGAGLLLRTFDSLSRVGLGFEPAETVTMNLFLGVRPPEARIALVDQILDRVRRSLASKRLARFSSCRSRDAIAAPASGSTDNPSATNRARCQRTVRS